MTLKTNFDMKKIALIIAFLLTGFSLLAQSVMVTANLPGRTLKTSKMSIPEYDFSESGMVIVTIEVNRAGKVISANAGVDGTTLSSALLWTKCRKAAQEIVFEEKNDAEESQEGTIVYVFYSESSAPAVESPGRTSSNPLAGADLPDSFSLLENPIPYQGAKKFKILQVIAKDGALAQSEDTRYRSIEAYGDPVVLLISDQPNVYYDDLVISVGVRQKTVQLGTYRYETRMGISKTVPIVMIVDK